MRLATGFTVPALYQMQRLILVCVFCAFAQSSFAEGTRVGTVIENTASIEFDLAGTPLIALSNTTTIVVAERINVVTTLQSPQTLVSPNDTLQSLLFSVTNTGNGVETFLLSIDSALAGDDFDPVPAVPAIYFDTDGSGDFNAGDVAYVPGTNDPVLDPDSSISVFIVNDIPAGVANGQIGQSQLTATAATGSGAAGTVFAGQGDGGADAVIGTTGGSSADVGEYLVSDVLISLTKAQLVADPFGGSEPIPGATISYTITAEVQSAGVASASTIRDAIPTFTTFVAASLTLNGTALTDAVDADAGELDTSATPSIVVRLGDLVQADGVQTIVFDVTID